MDKKETQMLFVCKCRKQEGWIHEGIDMQPCPICGRKYKCVYDKEKYTLRVVEIKEE